MKINNITWFQVFFNFIVLIAVVVKFQNPTLQRIITFTFILLIANVSVYNLVENLKKLKDLL
jgi:uncharacterized membrane protein